MPLIEELDTTVLSAYFSADYLAVRSPGPHLKVIVDDWLRYYGLYDKRNPSFAGSLEEFASMGFAWERAVVRALADGIGAGIDYLLTQPAPPAAVVAIYEHVFAAALNEADRERRPHEVVHVGEITHRGIHCTPDKYNKIIRGPDEYKCTWTSARGGLEAHPDWLMQVPGYCSALGSDTAIIRAFYPNGYYEMQRMGKPVVRAWKLRYSDAELDENWQLLEDHRVLMTSEGRL